jgi:hypothetical protein
MRGARNRNLRRRNAMRNLHISTTSRTISSPPASQSLASTRKKELIGEFKNPGQAWRREPESVLVHDFPQDAIGQAVPFGIYDLNHNHGFVRVGDCSDTPRFAVESVVDWWGSGTCSPPLE